MNNFSIPRLSAGMAATGLAIPIAIIILGILISGAIIYINLGKNILPSNQIGERAINYINQEILMGRATASLVEIKEESGVYKLKIKVGDEEFDSYATKDGRILFPEGIDLINKPSQETPTPTPTSTPSPTQYPAGALENLAKCLTQKGMKFYGASWCGWCKKQKELFGEAAKFLPYIECIDEKTEEMTAECKNAGITGFPTWETPDKKRESGFQSPEKLAELSGCSF